MTWRERAACRGADLGDFYPVGDVWTAEQADRAAAALAYCARCPVVAECLTAALDEGDRWAVRGATLPEDRRRTLSGAA